MTKRRRNLRSHDYKHTGYLTADPRLSGPAAEALVAGGFTVDETTSELVAPNPDEAADISAQDGGQGQSRTLSVYECQSCGEWHTLRDLEPMQDIAERVAPDEPIPAGQCRDDDCGAVCHAVPNMTPAGAVSMMVEALGSSYSQEAATARRALAAGRALAGALAEPAPNMWGEGQAPAVRAELAQLVEQETDRKDLIGALRRVVRKIDHTSGSPVFSAGQHNTLAALLARVDGREYVVGDSVPAAPPGRAHDLHLVAGALLAAVRRSRLMLYAWKAARWNGGLWKHPELLSTIAETEAAIAKAEGREPVTQGSSS